MKKTAHLYSQLIIIFLLLFGFNISEAAKKKESVTEQTPLELRLLAASFTTDEHHVAQEDIFALFAEDTPLLNKQFCDIIAATFNHDNLMKEAKRYIAKAERINYLICGGGHLIVGVESPDPDGDSGDSGDSKKTTFFPVKITNHSKTKIIFNFDNPVIEASESSLMTGKDKKTKKGKKAAKGKKAEQADSAENEPQIRYFIPEGVKATIADDAVIMIPVMTQRDLGSCQKLWLNKEKEKKQFEQDLNNFNTDFDREDHNWCLDSYSEQKLTSPFMEVSSDEEK